VSAIRRIIAGLVLAVLAALPALSETVQLEQSGGVYMLPVRINDTLTIPFVLDSGASEVVLTEDIFSVLRRAKTVSQSDFVGTGTYTVANGATISSDRYIIHKMSVGDHVITDVIANVVSVKADPLLGQTFLQKLPAWTLDNAQHALVIGDAGEQQVATIPLQRTPSTPAKRPATASGALLKDIFGGDMWNIQVPFLESKVGVARRVLNVRGGQIRTYTVDGCEVTAYVRKNAVAGYGLILGRDQHFDKDDNCNITIPGPDHLSTKGMTIGTFISTNGIGIAEPQSLFTAPCISMCGNAADPTVVFHYEGPHASNFMKIDLMSTTGDQAAFNAAEQWAKLMTNAEGKNYVTEARFNCDGKYQKLGLQLFQNVEPYRIVIGFGDFTEESYLTTTCGNRR
jgi:hypothetical protein